MAHIHLSIQAASADDFDPDRDTLFDIPVDDNTAEVTCAIVKISDTDKLYGTTKTLYERFDPTRVSLSQSSLAATPPTPHSPSVSPPLSLPLSPLTFCS